MRVAAIGRGAELDQVAGEQHLLLGQPGDRVAACVAAAGMDDLHLARAQPQRHPLVEDEVGPGQAGDRLLGAEQAREALDLGIHVLLAALDDHAARDVAGDDVDPLLVAGGAQHAHGVVVGEQHVADRLVGHLADLRHQLLGHHRRRARVDHQHRIVADHHARVRVALGGQREHAGRQLVEGLALLGQIALARECLAHVDTSLTPRAGCSGRLPARSRRRSSARPRRCISIRTRSPKLSQGVLGVPCQIVSSIRRSARQEWPTSLASSRAASLATVPEPTIVPGTQPPRLGCVRRSAGRSRRSCRCRRRGSAERLAVDRTRAVGRWQLVASRQAVAELVRGHGHAARRRWRACRAGSRSPWRARRGSGRARVTSLTSRTSLMCRPASAAGVPMGTSSVISRDLRLEVDAPVLARRPRSASRGPAKLSEAP